MFKFPYNWLKEESEIPVEYDKLINWLTEQGFEIASISDVQNDKIIEIEVKANRPDMLSIAGVLREYYCARRIKKVKCYEPEHTKLSFEADCPVLGHKIKIDSSDVHRYYALGIENIDNSVKTPNFIVDRLAKIGVASINPVVDISNYIMLLIGQPTHVFDADKISGDIKITNFTKETKFITLSGQESVFPPKTLFISDDDGLLCAAGIIGGKRAEVTQDTKNIIIESANFDHVIERIASKKSHVSTLASYRFERGVSVDTAIIGCKLIANLINEICGGGVTGDVFEYTDATSDLKPLELSIKHTNALLGSNLSPEEIISNLERCYFIVEKKDSDTLIVTNPAFRLDIDDQVDLIEEVGRIYGYHNIEPQPVKLNISLKPNALNLATKKIRDILVGYGSIECLTYGFIPDNSMEMLGIATNDSRFFGDIKILNPLSNIYALMRPTMAYSLLSTAVNNLKAGCKHINIFELGKTYFRDKSEDDGYGQRSTLGVVLYGINQPKGFGIIRDNMYSIYDVLSVVRGIADSFNVNYEIKKTDGLKFLKSGSAGYIYFNNKICGCVGIVNKQFLEIFGAEKIAVSDMLYLEMDYDGLYEIKKSIKHERNYSSVVREYNFIVKNGLYFSDYKDEIYNASPYIIGVKPIDVYTGKGIEKGTASILIEVEYNAPDKAISLSEVEEVEQKFYERLKTKYGIYLKT